MWIITKYCQTKQKNREHRRNAAPFKTDSVFTLQFYYTTADFKSQLDCAKCLKLGQKIVLFNSRNFIINRV